MKPRVTVISSGSHGLFSSLRESIEYKELILAFAFRDIKVKFSQTIIGLTWIVLKPLLSLVILSFVFNKIAGVDTGEIPHLVFTMAGLVVWGYFASVITDAGNSLLENQSMIKKIYFPRIILPLSKSISALPEFCVSVIILLLLLYYYNISLTRDIFFLPLVILIVLLFGLSAGIFISAITIKYRDFRFITPFLVRIGLYVSPVAYSSAMVPEPYSDLYHLNPLVSVIEVFRASVLGTDTFSSYIYVSLALSVVFFVFSSIFFIRISKNIADTI